MKLAILHYHLNRGGVTQVIQSHVRALQLKASQLSLEKVVILHGGRADGWNGLKCEEFEIQVDSASELDYDGQTPRKGVRKALQSLLAAHDILPSDSILHVHNHALGKSAELPGALTELAKSGYRLLLQPHDFMEDLRPQNFQNIAEYLGDSTEVGAYLYPAAPHIQYAVLNQRDLDVLRGCGLEFSQVHLLPNPVTINAQTRDQGDARQRVCDALGVSREKPIITYPVRGIRRKNIGELLLWGAVFQAQATFVNTLPATSETEQPGYERWKTMARELKLPVHFEVGLDERLSFAEVIAASDLILTTSVAEGFGLTFLESWLHNKPLIGRNIPEITADFQAAGIDLSQLGNRFAIPSEWVDTENLVQQLLRIQADLCRSYSQPLPDDTESRLREKTNLPTLDFALLPGQQQEQIIRHVATEPGAAAQLIEQTPQLQNNPFEDPEMERIANNARSVRRRYSLQSTSEELCSIYSQLLKTSGNLPVGVAPSPQHVLDSFLDLDRLIPIRVEH